MGVLHGPGPRPRSRGAVGVGDVAGERRLGVPGLRCAPARDLEEFLGYFDPAVEFRSRLVDIEGTLYGHEGVREWWATVMDVFPDWNPSILEARDLGDWVLIHGRAQGSDAGSGAGVGDDYWQAVEIRNGRCVRYITCRTRSEALEVVGLRE